MRLACTHIVLLQLSQLILQRAVARLKRLDDLQQALTTHGIPYHRSKQGKNVGRVVSVCIVDDVDEPVSVVNVLLGTAPRFSPPEYTAQNQHGIHLNNTSCLLLLVRIAIVHARPLGQPQLKCFVLPRTETHWVYNRGLQRR